MNELYEWLRILVGTVILLGFLELLLPEGELHRFARMVLSLLVLLLLLQPMSVLFRQELALDRIAAGWTPERPAPPTDRAAARVSAAGLAALDRVRLAALEDSLRGLVGRGTVAVTADRDGQPRVVIRLPRGGDPERVRRQILSRYALPETAVEVRTDDSSG